MADHPGDGRANRRPTESGGFSSLVADVSSGVACERGCRVPRSLSDAATGREPGTCSAQRKLGIHILKGYGILRGYTFPMAGTLIFMASALASCCPIFENVRVNAFFRIPSLLK